MSESPFIYGKVVSEQAFTGRKDDIEKLKNNLLGGINTMIISPRRWGKSSLVEKVITGINNKVLLINNNIIYEVDDRYEFVDPAFELWFNKQYFGINYLQ